MAKIIGNTTSTTTPRADWNQTDETKADYIKNKPTEDIEANTAARHTHRNKDDLDSFGSFDAGDGYDDMPTYNGYPLLTNEHGGVISEIFQSNTKGETRIEFRRYADFDMPVEEYVIKQPKKTSELENDSGFITAEDIPESGGSVDLTDYYTKQEIDAKGFITADDIHESGNDKYLSSAEFVKQVTADDLIISETNTQYEKTDTTISIEDNGSIRGYVMFANSAVQIESYSTNDSSNYMIFARTTDGYMILNGGGSVYFCTMDKSLPDVRITNTVFDLITPPYTLEVTKGTISLIKDDSTYQLNKNSLQVLLDKNVVGQSVVDLVLGYSRGTGKPTVLTYSVPLNITSSNNLEFTMSDGTRYFVDMSEVIDQSSIYTNVKTFGAVGDGVTDDTQAIQNAIEYVHNIGGGTIYFPYGTYLLSTPLFLIDSKGNLSDRGHALEVYSNQRLVFDKGATLKRGSTSLNCIMFVANSTDATGYDGASNIEIIGATFDGNYEAFQSTVTTLATTHANNIRIVDCIFTNAGGEWHSIEINSSRDVIVDNCKFKNNQNKEDIQLDAAIGTGNRGVCDGTVCKDITIKNCIFDLSNGIAIGNHSEAKHCNTRIHDNVFRGGTNTSRGYIDFVSQHEKVDIYNNTFYGGVYGVVLNTITTNSAVFNNRFENVTIPTTGGLCSYNNMINGVLSNNNTDGTSVENTILTIDDFTAGFVDKTTGEVVTNETYPYSITSPLITLEAGKIYTLTSDYNYVNGKEGVRYRLYGANGDYIMGVDNALSDNDYFALTHNLSNNAYYHANHHTIDVKQTCQVRISYLVSSEITNVKFCEGTTIWTLDEFTNGHVDSTTGAVGEAIASYPNGIISPLTPLTAGVTYTLISNYSTTESNEGVRIKIYDADGNWVTLITKASSGIESANGNGYINVSYSGTSNIYLAPTHTIKAVRDCKIIIEYMDNTKVATATLAR